MGVSSRTSCDISSDGADVAKPSWEGPSGGGAPASFSFLDADGTSYTPSVVRFLDAVGTAYSTAARFLDADGTVYAVT